jgi:hypothetical protein
LVPFTVRVKPGSPATAWSGAMPVRVGTGLLMVNTEGAEVPPPGVGLNTVTSAVPAVAIMKAATGAVTCVGPTKVVTRSCPFHWTTELALKFVPFTVKVKPGSPAILLSGSMLVIVGTGLLMVNVAVPEVPPPVPGLKTVTSAVPAVAISPAGTAAVSWTVET